MTSILATVGPTDVTIKESERTLRYIQRAKLISNQVNINEKYNAKETEKMVALLNAMKSITDKFDVLVTSMKQQESNYKEIVTTLKDDIQNEVSANITNITQRINDVEAKMTLPTSDSLSQQTSKQLHEDDKHVVGIGMKNKPEVDVM